ncbi:MAG: transposase [Gammaproteobacteria bacterium]|nr:transposase [Gammaproteobacteria bacterium]
MDNAAFHKSEETKSLVSNAHCHLLFLPPYSPDFNSIAKFWANYKK